MIKFAPTLLNSETVSFTSEKFNQKCVDQIHSFAGRWVGTFGGNQIPRHTALIKYADHVYGKHNDNEIWFRLHWEAPPANVQDMRAIPILASYEIWMASKEDCETIWQCLSELFRTASLYREEFYLCRQENIGDKLCFRVIPQVDTSRLSIEKSIWESILSEQVITALPLSPQLDQRLFQYKVQCLRKAKRLTEQAIRDALSETFTSQRLNEYPAEEKRQCEALKNTFSQWLDLEKDIYTELSLRHPALYLHMPAWLLSAYVSQKLRVDYFHTVRQTEFQYAT